MWTWSPDDIDDVIALHSDPRVTRFLTGADGKPWPEEEAHIRLALWIEQHETRGYGKWKVMTRDGRFAGRAGIFDKEELDAIELGFTIHPDLQGQGLATEVAAGIHDWAFANLTIDRLVAFSNPDNIASQRVLEKISMTFTHEGTLNALPWRFYQIARL
ncbi:MAG: GNAT family N-acetyltransferase [Alphaproteobacteria bacterium]|nr:GNAT family N-acetyltransferase [Alphaproteobacteria bacterium]